MKKTIAFRTAAAASALGLALTLAACGSNGSNDASTEAGGTDAQQDEAVTAESALTLEDGWVKAVDKDHGMTAVFGTLKNSSDQDIHFTGAESSVAGMAELHETVEDNSGSTKMQEKEGGFVIPAGGELKLEPGGDHIMLMKLKEGIEPGAEVTTTLKTDAGDLDVTVPAKEFAGAQEEYDQGDGSDMDHGDMDHGDHDGHDHGDEEDGHDH
ncbi:copper chaperone PCu(A)C [Brevibacterium luteolum]|uniref:copper chaperone PCu(A)C n=1 Tax=Brevibacterium luteolum TaxID=199591 RepID=UPI00223C3C98|nr:copper chaperone PCu(A)C [Brevibacterium luteolum]MCT1829747.1 copper chaperone PCu(A)C [Brevibacterium luteolum]